MRGSVSLPFLGIAVTFFGIVLAWLHYEKSLRELLKAQKRLEVCAARQAYSAVAVFNQIEVLHEELKIERTLLKVLPPLTPEAAVLRAHIQTLGVQRLSLFQFACGVLQQTCGTLAMFFRTPWIQSPPDAWGPTVWPRAPRGGQVRFRKRFYRRFLKADIGLFYGTKKSTGWSAQWIRTGAR